MKKRLIAVIISCFFLLSLYSQRSVGGLPPSFNYTSSMLRSASVADNELRVAPDLDIERLIWEDEIADRNGNAPRVAVVVPVSVDMASTGQWSVLPDSTQIWQQTVSVEGAGGLIISYSDFYIPKGGKLYIYNKARTHILGAYTHDTYPQGGRFATEAISGDCFTLEYVASRESDEAPRIVIESVGYMYRNAACPEGEKCKPDKNSSASCMININCEEGRLWKEQKRGVVIFFVKLFNPSTETWGWTACTGSLINNTKQDGTPYVLTAHHCFLSNPEYDEVIVYFNHEFKGCNNENVMPEYESLVGITPCVDVPLNGGSDTYLYKLKDDVPKEWYPYYNGWDRRNNAANSGAVIHHPNYDVKKIILYDKAVTSDTYSDSNRQGVKNGHWRVVYDGNSVSQVGSSGSPLFNEEGLIVGTLSGGKSYCYARYNPDFYGKLWYAWDQHPNDSFMDRQLISYLDPLEKGVEYLEAYDPNSGHSGIEDEPGNITKELIMFPVPADDELNINTSSIIRNIKVYSMSGQLVFSKSSYTGSTATINVGAWTKGIYTVSVQTEAKTLTDKFLKK